MRIGEAEAKGQVGGRALSRELGRDSGVALLLTTSGHVAQVTQATPASVSLFVNEDKQ